LSTYRNIMQQPPKKLLDQVRDTIRLKHYSYRTEETYVQWIRRYILFHNLTFPVKSEDSSEERCYAEVDLMIEME
jgi:hypothetical protein